MPMKFGRAVMGEDVSRRACLRNLSQHAAAQWSGVKFLELALQERGDANHALAMPPVGFSPQSERAAQHSKFPTLHSQKRMF
eukprot:5305872-Pyramimonas_sp.AAC.1